MRPPAPLHGECQLEDAELVHWGPATHPGDLGATAALPGWQLRLSTLPFRPTPPAGHPPGDWGWAGPLWLRLGGPVQVALQGEPLPGRLAGASVQVDGLPPAPLMAPVQLAGACRLQLHFRGGGWLRLEGQGLQLAWADGARWFESLAC